MRRFLVSFLVMLLMVVTPLWAAEKDAKSDPAKADATALLSGAGKEPDISNILFMQNLKNIGAKIFYMGEQLGLHGWFIVKEKQVQILYTTADGRALLVGALLSPEGANISQQQVLTLASSNPEVQALIKDQPAAAKDAAPAPEPAKTAEETKNTKEESTVSPSEQFFVELRKATGLTFGKDTAPLVVMIMDVHCPFCHKAWKKFEPLVEGGKLRVMMIPIVAVSPQSEADAAIWLAKKDPYEAWKKHLSGDGAILKTGEPEPAKRLAVNQNTDLIKKWSVDQTPYILYHGKGGKVRLVIGLPQDVDAIMKDIAP